MHMPLSILAVLALATGTAAAAPSIRHVPPGGVTAGANLELVAEAPPATPKLVVHYRNAGGNTGFTALELVRKDDAHWIAVVPSAQVTAPGIEYYLDAGGELVFAGPQWPHTIPVNESATAERRTRDLRRIGGLRRRIHTSGEWVDYGTRTVNGKELVDRYYRLDADFSYRLLAYPLEEIHVGFTRLLGDTESMDCTDPPCTGQAGYRVGGWFGLGLGVVEGFRLDGRVAVMATQAGFKVGGRLEARLGVFEGSHVALGVESMGDVGTNGFFRLGWGTVPGLPMAATVEITNMPDNDRSTGVRLYYDIARDIGGGFKLGLRVGYAARTQQVAGFTGGANAAVEF